VSLIESALAKLRRAGETDAQPRASLHVPRATSLVAAAANGAAVPVVAPEPKAEEPAKRITLDLRTLRTKGYLPEEGVERRFADHYRHIKRPLIEKALADGPESRVIMVTSALPGDGKTFTSLNLALSIARERDASVLLVDGDAPKAGISEVLGLRGEPGLLDALADDSLDPQSLVVGTDVRGFEVLPAGRFVEGATELLASARMSKIAARLSARSPLRLVVFDSAPLLVSSEARVLLRIPGQVVLVLRVDATPRQAALDAAAYVDKKKLQGLILNHAPFRKGVAYYGYADYGSGVDKTAGSA
jgi:protein-tyrosine kinase